MEKPACSIVILSYNQLNYTIQCLDSIKTYTKDVSYEIIIVDNASDEATVRYLESVKGITLLKSNENRGFAGGCNLGISRAKGKYIMLLNNDTIVTSRWLFNMMDLLEKDETIGMAGPLTNSTVGKQMIEVPYGEDMEQMQQFAFELSHRENKPWKTLRLVAFCVLIRRSLLEKIGLFDTEFKIGNYEDDDFNIRALLAGNQSYICRNSFIHHFMNISFKRNNLPRERIMMKNKLLLEQKWDGMNWNHHAVYNKYIFNNILAEEAKNILHIGCGMGALAIELKDHSCEYHIVGIEDHPVRKKIADTILDKSIPYVQDSRLLLSSVGDAAFGTAVIECMAEKLGIALLQEIKRTLCENATVYLRVFNVKHITTLEKLFFGEAEGRLLCAVSDEFSCYFDKSVVDTLKDMGYRIEEVIEIKKTFSSRQEEIYKKISQFEEYARDCTIYNYIFKMRINTT